MTKLIYVIPLAIGLAACGGNGATDAGDTKATDTSAVVELAEKFVEASPGSYNLEKTHAFLYAEVSHNGLSQYRLNFTDIDASMTFDPSNPTAEANSISVTINPTGIVTNYPGAYKANHTDSPYESWDEDLAQNPGWFNAAEFPAITFTSTSLERTGDYTGKLTGDLSFLGVSKPVTLDITYNGVGNKPWWGERDLIGFNATGTFNRSDFGMTKLVGPIGDEVSLTFTGEFLQSE